VSAQSSFLTNMLDTGQFPTPVARLYRAVISLTVLLCVGIVVTRTVPDINLGPDSWSWPVERLAILLLAVDWLLQVHRVVSACPAGQGRLNAYLTYQRTFFGVIDAVAVLPMLIELAAPVPPDAQIVLGVVRVLKLARYLPALQTLASVLHREGRSLQSALFMMFLLLLTASTTLYMVERHVNPSAFDSIPHAMWWGIVTLTTVGYGDAVPLSPLGKMLAGCTALLGIGMFALPASILANGFAEEVKRRDFLSTWHMVAKVPFFSGLDADQIASITALLRVVMAAPGDVLIREGDIGDRMYFIVSGIVAVEFGGPTQVMLNDGEFFGEIALLQNTPRTATVTARSRCQLLTLDVKDFRDFIAKSPEMTAAILKTAEQRLFEQTQMDDPQL